MKLFRYLSFNRIKRMFFMSLANILPLRRHQKLPLIKWGGVNVKGDKLHVGKNVVFDSMYPESIYLGYNVHIANNVTILTHYLDTSKNGINFLHGEIHIGDNVFIGTGVIISKACNIGDNAIVGAGSIVTKDIPANEIWAGNPAKFIKKRS